MAKNRLIKSKYPQLLILLCSFFLFCTIISLAYYVYKKLTLVTHVGKKLNQNAIGIEKEILAIINVQKDFSSSLGQNAEFVALAQQLNKTFVRGAVADFKNTPPAYQEIELRMDQFLSQYRGIDQIKDIFFIQKDGTIFYINKGETISANILEHDYKHSALTRSFERVKTTFTIDVSEFDDDPLTKAPALFILYPLIEQDKDFFGVVAIQLDEVPIYKMVQTYPDFLGQTGDILLAKNIGDRVLFIAPSRFASSAFKKVSNPDKEMKTAIRKASLGYQGFGLASSSDDKKVIAAWRFIPQVNWGLAIRINYQEALNSLRWLRILVLTFLLITLLLSIILLFLLRHEKHAQEIYADIFSRRTFHTLVLASAGLCFMMAGLLAIKRYSIYRSFFNKTKNIAVSKVNNQAEFIRQSINEVEKTAQMLANDMRTGYLKKEDITVRITRDLKGLPHLNAIIVAFEPFAYSKEERLYGIQAKRTDDKVQTELIGEDHMIPGSNIYPQSDWYNKTIKRGAFWSQAYTLKDSNVREIRYSLPFYEDNNSEPAGVIAVMYNLDKITRNMQLMEIGKTGYGLIISDTGSFVYHPLEQYVRNKTTILDIAREQNSSVLKKIATNMMSKKSGFESYKDPNTWIRYWMTYTYVPNIQWTVAAIFSEEALELPHNQLHKLFVWIFIFIVLGLLFVALSFTQAEDLVFFHIRRFAVCSSIILFGSLIFFWAIMYSLTYKFPMDNTIIRD